MPSKMCIECGATKPLTAYHRLGYGARRCSACQSKRLSKSSDAYESRVCVGCGKSFKSLRAQLLNSPTHKGLYCSQACRKLQVTLHCHKCHAMFSVWPCMANRRKFCSKVCARTGGGATFETVLCAYCGEVSRPFRASVSVRRKYCSSSCANKARRKRPENVYGRTSCVEWYEARWRVLDRDGHACVLCGSKWKLDVHHIVPWAETQDNSPANLTTLCKKCHTRHHNLARHTNLGGVQVSP